MPIAIVCDLEKHKLAGSEWIHRLESFCEKTEKEMIKYLLTDNVTVATRAQKKLLHIVFILNVWLISYERPLRWNCLE